MLEVRVDLVCGVVMIKKLFDVDLFFNYILSRNGVFYGSIKLILIKKVLLLSCFFM